MQAGDVVVLKSGGPTMTIKWIEDGEAWCEWFVAAKNTGARFALTSLEKA